MSDLKIHERKHPLYEQYIDDWIFYLESYTGGDEYIEKHLKTHRLENSQDFVQRKSRAYYLNYCDPIVTIPSDYIFKKEATRPTDEHLTPIRANIDYQGTDINEFMRQVSIFSAIYGQIHILIDSIKPPDYVLENIRLGRTTKLDVQKFPPYATLIHPQNLLDWSVDKTSQSLNWILLYEKVYVDADFTEERQVKQVFKVWTRDKWITFDESDNIIDSGSHDLGQVPLITHYHKNIDLDLVGESMLNGVAETNRSIFNWCSDVDEMIARQTFSQLICPDDGSMLTDEVDEQGKSSALKKVGSSTIFTFPSDSRHAPAFISPDTKQIDIIWDMVQHHVLEMFRMAGLVSEKSSIVQLQQRTGKAQEFEFLDMAVFFANKAKQLEHTENKMNELFYKWLDLSDTPERVHYPEKFDIISPEEIVDLFTKVTLNTVSGTLNKEMAKRLVLQVLPHAEDEVVRKIYKEIDENKILEDPTILTLGNQTQHPPATDVSKKEESAKVEKADIKKEPVPNTKNPKRRAKFRSPQQ